MVNANSLKLYLAVKRREERFKMEDTLVLDLGVVSADPARIVITVAVLRAALAV